MTQASRLEIIVDSSKAKREVDNLDKALSNVETHGDKASKAVQNVGNEANAATGKFSALKKQLIDTLGNSRFGGMINDVNTKLATLNGTAGIVTAGLAGMAVGGIATATSALALLAIQSAKADAQLAVLAKRANVNTTSFQILEYAALQLGMSQDGLAQSLADAQEKLGEFTASGGGGEAADFFDALKNNTKMTDKQIKEFAKTLQGKDGVEVLQLMKTKLDDLGASAQEQRFIFESLGNDLGNLLPLFANGGVLLDEFGVALEDAGVIKSKEAIAQAKVLATQTQAVNLQFQGAKNQLVTGFTPSLTSLAEAMFASSENGVTLKDVGAGLGTVFKTVGSIALGVAASVKVLGNGLGGLAAITVKLIERDFNGAKAIYDELDNNSASVFDDFFMRMDKMWNSTEANTSSSNKLANALLNLNNATDQQNKGLKVNVKDAKEAEKATAQLAKEQENLNKLVGVSSLSGLRLKSMESVAGGKVRGYTAEFAQLTQDLLGDKLTRFTAFNDSYHKGTNSKHATGNAFDFTVKNAKEAEAAVAKLNEMALKYGFTIKTINEYANPSKRATGGHVHVSVLGFKGGNDQLKDAKAEAKLIDDSYQSSLKVANQIKAMQIKFDSESIARSKARDEEINNATLLGQTQLIPKIKERYDAQDKLAQLQLDSELNGYKWTEEQKLEVTKQINILRLDAEGKLSDDQKAIAKKAYDDIYQYDIDAFRRTKALKFAEFQQGMLNEINFSRDLIAKNTMMPQRYQQFSLMQSYLEAIRQTNMDEFSKKDAVTKDKDLTDTEKYDQLLQIEAAYQEKRFALISDFSKREQDLRTEQAQSTLNTYESIMGGLAGMLDKNSKEYAVAISVQRGIAVASATMAAWQAYTQAFADPTAMTLPQKFAGAASVLAAVMPAIQAISSARIPAYRNGGLVTGAGTGTSDSIIAKLSNGEHVATAWAVNKIGAENYDYMNRTGQLPPNRDDAQLNAINRQQRQNELISSSRDNYQISAPQSPPEVNVPVFINNITDKDEIPDAMATPAGTRVILNIIKREATKINTILGGRSGR